jgi:pyrroloquinoline quinone biosynthesis protein B
MVALVDLVVAPTGMGYFYAMVEAMLLGTAQDGGVPQAGCRCANCSTAWADPPRCRLVSSLGIVERETGVWFLIDATPDLPQQWHMMQEWTGATQCGGILLTHAHIGHYSGLIHLGFEAMSARELPVWATARMSAFLRANAPWRQLEENGHIVLRDLAPECEQRLTDSVYMTALPVPHRDELSDTMAFRIRGPRGQLLYLPDIDAWEQWDRSVAEEITAVDVALLDGTFFNATELPGRDMSAIAHPLVTDTVARLAGTTGDVRFIHLNHTNPLHREGNEKSWLMAQGFRVGEVGDRWEL